MHRRLLPVKHLYPYPVHPYLATMRRFKSFGEGRGVDLMQPAAVVFLRVIDAVWGHTLMTSDRFGQILTKGREVAWIWYWQGWGVLNPENFADILYD